MAKKTSIINERGAFSLENLRAINKAQEEPIKAEEQEEEKPFTVQARMRPIDIERYNKLFMRFIVSAEIGGKYFKNDFFNFLLNTYADYLKKSGKYETPANRDIVPNLMRRAGRRKKLSDDVFQQFHFAYLHGKDLYDLWDDVLYSISLQMNDVEKMQKQSFYYVTMIDYFEKHFDEIVADYNNKNI